jgi:hypothetical protein
LTPARAERTICSGASNSLCIGGYRPRKHGGIFAPEI